MTMMIPMCAECRRDMIFIGIFYTNTDSKPCYYCGIETSDTVERDV